MKSLTWLLDVVLQEAALRCDTDTHRDIRTISRRIEHEGISFLTITLPRFAKDFERSLELGVVDSSLFLGFKKRLSLPALLQGLTSQVFNPMDGKLLPHPSPTAVECIRQVCLMYKKVLIPCTPKRLEDAEMRFLEVEKELADFPHRVDGDLLSLFGTVSGMLWNELGSTMYRKITEYDLVPRHGPGATAEKISGNGKFRLQKWHNRLEPYFPFDMYGLTSPDIYQWEGPIGDVEFVEPEAEQPVRVVFVPKTLLTPRVIAIEPVCNQYIQQALMHSMVDSIENMGCSAGHVNFHDQGINQDLALQASKSGTLATIDMSEASDRVHKDLVDRMLRSVSPLLRDAVEACRSTSATLPSGVTIPLEKFASMGSGLCFPIESMVFFTLCVLSRLTTLNLHPSPRNIEYVARDIYVYGDDIVAPADEVSAIARILETFCLKVNTSKTFSHGKFRESCGMDAYAGHIVTPTYVRHMPPRNRQDVREIVSYVSLANQLYLTGWWASARTVRRLVESLLGKLPIVRETSPSLGWVTYSQGYSISRFDPETQSYKVKGWTLRVKKVSDRLDDHGALMKFFLKTGEEPASEGHLEHTVRPGCVTLQSRWVSPF